MSQEWQKLLSNAWALQFAKENNFNTIIWYSIHEQLNKQCKRSKKITPNKTIYRILKPAHFRGSKKRNQKMDWQVHVRGPHKNKKYLNIPAPIYRITDNKYCFNWFRKNIASWCHIQRDNTPSHIWYLVSCPSLVLRHRINILKERGILFQRENLSANKNKWNQWNVANLEKKKGLENRDFLLFQIKKKNF